MSQRRFNATPASDQGIPLMRLSGRSMAFGGWLTIVVLFGHLVINGDSPYADPTPQMLDSFPIWFLVMAIVGLTIGTGILSGRALPRRMMNVFIGVLLFIGLFKVDYFVVLRLPWLATSVGLGIVIFWFMLFLPTGSDSL